MTERYNTNRAGRLQAAVQVLAPTPPNDTDREADTDDAPSSTGAPA
jgi:hypothetical protein